MASTIYFLKMLVFSNFCSNFFCPEVLILQQSIDAYNSTDI